MSKIENISKELEIYEKIKKEEAIIKQAYKYSIVSALINIFIVITSIIFMFYALSYKSPIPYILADENGRIMKESPLSEFERTSAETGQWLADAIKDSFSYNFTNLETHPSRVKKHYTNSGFQKYKEQFERSTTRVFIKENTAVAFAGRISAPILVFETVSEGGTAVRKYEATMNQIMQGYKGQRVETYKITAIVFRMPLKEYSEGLAIGSIISEKVGEN